MELKENERIDDLEYKGLKIIQNENYFCFGMDSILLSDFAKEIKKGHMSWKDIQPDFENDYCKISWIEAENLQKFLNNFI